MHAAIYQNHSALHYLLASKGGIYGEFYLSNCCLQIHAERSLRDYKLRKTAHFPNYTWKGWDPRELFGEWCSTLRGSKTLILGTYMTLPCLAPSVICSVSKLTEMMVE